MDRADLMRLVYADGQPFVPETVSGKPRCRGRAKSRGGAQCAEATVPGATVCRIHGGAAPQVGRAARLRLIEAIEPAIATLIKEMAQADRPADRIKAANSLLDRAGVPRVTETSVDAAREAVLQEMIRMRNQRVAARQIEGEVIQ